MRRKKRTLWREENKPGSVVLDAQEVELSIKMAVVSGRGQECGGGPGARAGEQGPPLARRTQAVRAEAGAGREVGGRCDSSWAWRACSPVLGRVA